ncbi:MAG: hypothetical protein ABI835_08395, partial [Chloroflexota bacterium]
FLAAGRDFNADITDKIAILKTAFRMNSFENRAYRNNSALALNVAQLLKPEELQELFSELLGVASYYHGGAGFAQELILSLPHEWLLSNIEFYSEPLLRRADYETYSALLTLYSKIDRNLTRRLAQRAMNSDDADIHETGEDFLAQLSRED